MKNKKISEKESIDKMKNLFERIANLAKDKTSDEIKLAVIFAEKRARRIGIKRNW